MISYINSYEKNYHMYFSCVSYKNIFTYNTYINTHRSIYIIYIYIYIYNIQTDCILYQNYNDDTALIIDVLR